MTVSNINCFDWLIILCLSTANTIVRKDELLNGEIFTTLVEAKIIIEQWHREYNEVRPHSALGYRPPISEANLSLSST